MRKPYSEDNKQDRLAARLFLVELRRCPINSVRRKPNLEIRDDIVVDSGKSEHVVSDPAFLADV